MRLCVTKRFRVKYEGSLSETPGAALQWDRRRGAEERAEKERMLLPNRLYGHMAFEVVPINGAEAP